MKYENFLNKTSLNPLGNEFRELIIILNKKKGSNYPLTEAREELDQKFSWVSKLKKEIQGLILEKTSSNFGIIALYDLQEYTLKSKG